MIETTVELDRTRTLARGRASYEACPSLSAVDPLRPSAEKGGLLSRVQLWWSLAAAGDPELTEQDAAAWLDQPRYIARLERAVGELYVADLAARLEGREGAVPDDPHRCPVDAEFTPAVAVMLDKPRWVVRDMRCYLTFETETGIDSTDGKTMNALTPVQEMTLVWAHLLTDDPALQLETVLNWLDEPTLLGRIGWALEQVLAAEMDMAVADERASGDGGGSAPLGEPGGSSSPPGAESAAD